jgi:hypothetical protein
MTPHWVPTSWDMRHSSACWQAQTLHNVAYTGRPARTLVGQQHHAGGLVGLGWVGPYVPKPEFG